MHICCFNSLQCVCSLAWYSRALRISRDNILDYNLVYKGGCATENDNGPPKIGSKNDVELKGCHDYCQRTDTCQFYEYNTGMLAR